MSQPTVTDVYGYLYLIGFIASGACTALLAVTIYFFKKLTNELEDVRDSSKVEFDRLYARLDLTQKDIVNSFHTVCHERQNACSRLVQEKVDRVKSESSLTCKKLQDLEQRRSKRWELQESTNKRFDSAILKKLSDQEQKKD